MKNNLKQSNLPFLLLIVLIIKSMFLLNPIFDSFAIVSLSCLFGFKLWLDHVKKPDYNQILKKEFKDELSKQQNQIKEVNEKVSAFSAALNFQQKKNNASSFKW